MKSEIVVVGSGAGGATLAKELAAHGKQVMVLERGSYGGSSVHYRNTRDLVSLISSFYRKLGGVRILSRKIGIRSRLGVGGATVIASANAVRAWEEELQSFGIDINVEFDELEQELKVSSFPAELMGKGVKRICEAGETLGFKIEPMPKIVDFNKCDGCGKCNIKCPRGAKWTALDYIHKAKENGALIYPNVLVNKVLTSNGKVIGVEAIGPKGDMIIYADVVVLAAGAIETPIILNKSGIDKAGQKLFCHPFYIIYGPSKNITYKTEPHSIINSQFIHEKGFYFVNCVFTKAAKRRKNILGLFQSRSAIGNLGLMMKIKDNNKGKVYKDGFIKKTFSSDELKIIKSSVPWTKEVLIKAGVDHKKMKVSFHSGVHPGGTAAIGEIVDENLETEIKNCYISDASVLPKSAGLPPMLTIMALAKHLSKRLIN